MGSLVRVDNAVFRREVLESELPVLVNFTAPWSSVSQRVDAVVGELARQFAGVLKIAQIDCDGNSDILSEYAVQGLPATLLFYRGKEVGRTALRRKEDLKAWIEKRLREV